MLKGRLAQKTQYGKKAVPVSKQERRTEQRRIRREWRGDAAQETAADTRFCNFTAPLKSHSRGNRMSDLLANNSNAGHAQAEGLIQCQTLFHNGEGRQKSVVLGPRYRKQLRKVG